MTIRRSTSLLIAGVLIACTTLSNVRGQQDDKRPSLVKISAESLGVEQCSQSIDDERHEVRSNLRLRFSITNVSDQTLIVYLHGTAAFDAKLSSTLAGLKIRKFVQDARPPFRCLEEREFLENAPSNEFRILKPNESFTDPSPRSLLFTDMPSIYSDKKLEGDYFMQLKVATWFWGDEKAEILRQRWGVHGHFLSDDVVTEPIAITIPKPGATTPRCDTVSLK